MNTITPAIHDLVRRLIALEAARDPSDGLAGAVVRACEKLRVPLAKLVGMAGFRSLMSRALAMSKAVTHSLDAVQMRPDGSLEGLGGIQDAGAGAAIVAQLLGLLVIFVGEPLALRLVRDAWPGESVAEIDAGTGEGS